MTRNAWREKLYWAMKSGSEGLRRLCRKHEDVFSSDDRLRLRLIGPGGWERTYRALQLEFYQRQGKKVPDRNYRDGAVLAVRYIWLPKGCTR